MSGSPPCRPLLLIAALAVGCGSDPSETGVAPVRELEVGVLYEEGAPLYDMVREVGDELERDVPGARLRYTFNNSAARPALGTRILAGDALDVDLLFEGMHPNT